MASDYSELVKALRCCAENFGCPIECPRYSPADEGVRACVSRLEKDAADAIEELMKNLDMASQELSWTISYAMHLMRDIDELHDMVNEVYYDEL